MKPKRTLFAAGMLGALIISGCKGRDEEVTVEKTVLLPDENQITNTIIAPMVKYDFQTTVSISSANTFQIPGNNLGEAKAFLDNGARRYEMKPSFQLEDELGFQEVFFNDGALKPGIYDLVVSSHDEVSTRAKAVEVIP
jgi:hypothetical protein